MGKLSGKVNITTSRETVCALAGSEIQDEFSMSVKGSLGPECKEQVEAFKAEVEKEIGSVEGLKMEVNVQLGPGCQYDTIKKVVPINGGDPVNLEHKEGEVWLVDFWATWCPPCQKPMAHNEEMLKKREADWAGKVRIIGISIDQTREAVEKHVEAKDWKRPEHYWRAKSDCSDQYAVRGVPNVMLIDTKGKIVFKGHPASRPDLEKDFDDLLAGKEITGEGTGATKPAEEESSGSAPASKLDPAACLATIDEFASTVGPALQKDEKVKEAAKQMPRAFCVMVYEEKYDPRSQSSSVDWKNYRVLVGKQDAINTCKEVIEANVKGDYEVVLREHPM